MVYVKNSELRIIPFKNYVILGVVLVVTMFLLYYFCLWVDAYNESKINRPILNRYMEVINYNELDNYVVENPDTIIYVSVLENEKIREFEIQVKDLFKDDEITNELLYLDLTSEINDLNIVNEINNKYSLNSLSLVDVPCVLVIDDGLISSIYSVSDNGYDIDKFKSFVNSVKLGD